jgi:tRNA threonylcarbamoyladenosine biosynthesis protein TsaE
MRLKHAGQNSKNNWKKNKSMIQTEVINDDTSRVTLESLEDCKSFAQSLAKSLAPNLPRTVGLVGTLGAGKTQLVKFLAQALGAHPEDVISPTFVLIHPIDTYPQIYHIDAYRIHDSDEFLELGIEELFEQQAITIIEWADRFVECLPKNTLWIELACEDPPSQRRTVLLRNLSKLPDVQDQLRHSYE